MHEVGVGIYVISNQIFRVKNNAKESLKLKTQIKWNWNWFQNVAEFGVNFKLNFYFSLDSNWTWKWNLILKEGSFIKETGSWWTITIFLQSE